MAPKPDNPGLAIRDLVHGIQADTPPGENLGQAIRAALGDTDAQASAAHENLGKLVRDFAQSHDPATHDLGQQVSDFIHTQHDA